MDTMSSVVLERIADCMNSLCELSGSGSEAIAQLFQDWRLNPPNEAVRNQIEDPVGGAMDLSREFANSLLLAVAYLANAAKFADDANAPGMPDKAAQLLSLTAFAMISNAEFWHGAAWELEKQGYRVAAAEVRAARKAVAKKVSEHNKRAAAGRHKEAHESCAMVRAHFTANRDKYDGNKRKAAEAMANKLVPYPYATVRDWLTNL